MIILFVKCQKNLTQRDHTGNLIWKHAFICCYYVVLLAKVPSKRGESVARGFHKIIEKHLPGLTGWILYLLLVSQGDQLFALS